VTSTRRRPCIRCGQPSLTGWHWPDGYVCVSCARRGVRRRGPCPGCKTVRVLPGLDRDGRPLCVDCARIGTCFVCDSCGAEGELWFARTCLRCSLRRRAGEALADQTGQVPAALRPLHEAVAAMANPWAGLIWLQPPAVRARLHALATGAVPASHEGLDRLPPGRGREYLRELLMVHRIIPACDKYLLAFERWSADRIEAVDDDGDRQLIRLYLRWRHHRELAARATAGPLPGTAVATARARTNAGLRLLAWLRARNVTLGTCTQVEVDAWYATASNPAGASDFLTWAIRQRHCPPLILAGRQRRSPTAGSEQERIALLSRLVDDQSVDLTDRVAGCLVLLLAQPLTRVVALTIDQIESRGEEAWIRLGQQPIPLPEPVGRLVLALIGRRPNMTTAGHPASPWLFPGQAPGQHLHPKQLSVRLVRLGVNGPGRQAALHQLVIDIPAPLLAETLGYHPQTVARRAGELATDWAGYAALKARAATGH